MHISQFHHTNKHNTQLLAIDALRYFRVSQNGSQTLLSWNAGLIKDFVQESASTNLSIKELNK